MHLAEKVKSSDDPLDSPTVGFKMFGEGTYPLKTIIIKTKNGRTFEESMDCPPGHPKNMMTRKQFAERFRIQASPVLSDEKTRKAIDVLFSLENCKDISCLGWMLHT
jgi:2-methylcitrate dehydratase PrpD